jgi:hypothetical protein
MNTKIIYTVLFFIFIILTGFRVSRGGKPYNAGIFAIHKLIGLALGVFLIVIVSRVHKAIPLSSLEISALIATILIFVGLVAAGALLSIEAEGGLKQAGHGLLTAITLVHRILPYLAVFFTAASLYLLLIRRG